MKTKGRRARGRVVSRWMELVCAAEQTGGRSYVMDACSPAVSFSSHSVIIWMRPTAGLFCSSALPRSPPPSLSLPLSLQVCDFMHNYLDNYSSLHPTVSGGLLLSGVSSLSFSFDSRAHTQTLHGPVVRLVLSLPSVSPPSSEAGLF